jgi:hypothetical protein
MKAIENIPLVSQWLRHPRLRRVQGLAFVVGIALAPVLIHRTQSGAATASSKPPQIQRARMSDEVSVHAAGRGNPWINLSDGHELITPYSGPAELTQILERNEACPLSLCSADFDEDGVPDLISGYATTTGGGIVTLLRGNVDSIYPNAPEANQRRAEGAFTDAPFLSPAFVFGVPEAADFAGAGDFDGDSHWDMVAAKHGSNRLYLLSGDGKGGLALSRTIALEGAVTALVVGEINRRDGLNDIVVAIDGETGAKALVFEGPEGALKAKPEAFTLPAVATSLALGQLDDQYEYDLAIAAGKELMIVSGRDRKLSLNADRQSTVKAADVSKQTFGFEIHSIAIGDFEEGNKQEIALLCGDGKIRILSREDQTIAEPALEGREGPKVMPPQTDTPTLDRHETTSRRDKREQNTEARNSVVLRKQEPRWRAEVLREGSWSSQARLVNIRISSIPLDNVLVIEKASRQLDVAVARMSDERLKATTEQGVRKYPTETLEAQMETGAGATAVLPMRLNSDALSDLVILKSNQSEVTVAATQSQSIFRVTNTNDSGPGSLRQAIIDTSANPGANAITFNIPGGVPQSIKLVELLPAIPGPVTVDATTQPGFAGTPVIELNGKQVEGPGIRFTNANSVVRGLVINRFDTSTGIVGGVGNLIEGNFIGTDKTGTVIQANDLGISGGRNIVIGGTTSAARNIISGNFTQGILIGGSSSTGNLVQGNYIGTDLTGTVALPNGFGNPPGINGRGVDITDFAANNLIGGAVAGAGNVISGNHKTGVDLTASQNIVQGNYIGLDKNGTASLGNSSAGVAIASPFDPSGVRPPTPAGNNTIGGTTKAARNVISGNKNRGVVIVSDPAPGNLVQGNFIGTDATGTAPVGNAGEGVLVTASPQCAVGGSTIGAGNLISGNSGIGISLGLLFESKIGGTGTLVQSNFIGTDVTGSRPLGNGQAVVFGQDGIFVEVESLIHTIKDNLIAFNKGNGVNIPNVGSSAGTPGFRISILANSVFSNGALGINLGDAGVTANDNGDPDTGANELQNFPVLTSSGASTPSLLTNRTTSALVSASVSGTFNSTPNSTFTLQFFFGSNCQGTGHQFTGLIPVVLDPTIQVMTDGNGNAAFTYAFQFPTGFGATGFVNAAATNSTGNTSELSECIAVTNPSPSVPLITSACKGDGKQLIINGTGFVDGAKVFLNDDGEKTQFVSSTQVIAFKAGKRAQTGDTLKVRNPDATETPQITYTRVNCSP